MPILAPWARPSLDTVGLGVAEADVAAGSAEVLEGAEPEVVVLVLVLELRVTEAETDIAE